MSGTDDGMHERGHARKRTSRRRAGRRVAALIGSVAIAMANGGCATDSSTDSPSPTPSPTQAATRAATARYTFSWPLRSDGAGAPRGGTTHGSATTVDPAVHPGWLALQEEGLEPFERDRRAILAMAGDYRVSFDFLEVYALDPDYEELDVPYQSWATERVIVVEDRPDFISLQHVIVLFFEVEGETIGPHVTKHWRQDWHYEDTDLHVYRGRGLFERVRLDPKAVPGTWTQAVYQVDDSPRYEAVGRWRHDGNRSVWESGTTWRPLPRREFSVRNDYQALVGRNTHAITPHGWIHRQENAKRVVPDDEAADDPPHYIAEEIGLNRYVRIVDFDFSAADAYWEATGPYWREVRLAWEEILRDHGAIEVLGEVDGKKRFVAFFEAADAYAKSPDDSTLATDVRALVERYVVLRD